jgi:hypothetical protein
MAPSPQLPVFVRPISRNRPRPLRDGIFFAENTCYTAGVFWINSTGSTPTVDIDLQGTFTIDSAIVQADNNDAYTLQYRDTTGTYHDW